MKHNRLSLLLASFLLTSTALMSCGTTSTTQQPAISEDGTITLRVYNWAEYILPDMSASEAADNGYYEDVNGNGVYDKGVDTIAPVTGINTRFENYMWKKYHKKVNVVYDLFSTNEDMINQLRTGKISYDLICPSDYAIQRMMTENLLLPFDNPTDYPGSTPNYDKYVSPFLKKRIENISGRDMYHATQKDPSISSDKVPETTNTVDQFMRGYMWGTVGMTYNPTYKKFEGKDIENDVKSWEIFYDKNYEKTQYVKDSLREGYILGLQHVLNKNGKAAELKKKYESKQITADQYNKTLNDALNDVSDQTLKDVSEAITELSSNIYGYETDNGKEEIQTGKTIGVTQSYSGDAVYSMNAVDSWNETHTDQRPVLYYSLPDTGSNIWFDGWVMTKYALQHQVTDVAQAYVDFLCNPNIEEEYDVDNNGNPYDMAPVVANIDYIGYTPFIASDAVFDYIRESYDLRAEEEEPDYTQKPEGEEGKDYLRKDVSYFFNGTSEENQDWNIYYPVDQKNRQLDAMYPDESILPSLIVYKDFGTSKTNDVIDLWEASRSLQFPLWGYYLTLAIVLLIIGLYVGSKIKHRQLIERRKARMAQLVLQSNSTTITSKQKAEAQKIIDKNQKKQDVALQKELNKENHKKQ